MIRGRVPGLLTVLAMTTASCTGSADGAIADPDNETRTDRAVVLVTDLDTEHRAILDDLGHRIDAIHLLGGDCPADLDAPACVDELAAVAAITAGRIAVVMTDSTEPAAQLNDDLLARVELFLHRPAVSDLARRAASVSVVPTELSQGRTAGWLLTAVAIDDTVARFEIEVVDGVAQRVATAVDEQRLALVASRPEDNVDERALPDDADVPQPEVEWRIEHNGPTAALHSGAAIADGVLYVTGYDGMFRAVDADSGDVVWQQAIGVNATPHSLVSLDDTIVVTRYEANPPSDPLAGPSGLVAFDREDGTVLWRLDNDAGFAGHPLVANGSVYAWLTDDDGSSAFVALDGETGTERWRTEAPIGRGQARFVEGVVYAGSRDGLVYGFEATTGEIVARLGDGAQASFGGVASTPTVSAGLMLFGGDDGVFRAVELASGTEAWQFDTGEPSLPSSPVVHDGVVIFGAYGDSALYALDVATGEPVWRTPTPSPVLSSPALAGAIVVVGTGIHVDGYDAATGDLQWRHSTLDRVSDSPVIDGNRVFIQSFRRIEALRLPATDS